LFAPISEVKFLQVKHIIEPFVVSVGFVHNEEGRDSKLRNLSIEGAFRFLGKPTSVLPKY